MFRPLSIFIGIRYTGAKRRNHFISFISMTSMIGLALGVLAMIVVLSVMNGFDREMRTKVLGMVPHATIESSQPIDDWRSLAAPMLKHQQVLAAVSATTKHPFVFSTFVGRKPPLKPIMIATKSSISGRCHGGGNPFFWKYLLI